MCDDLFASKQKTKRTDRRRQYERDNYQVNKEHIRQRKKDAYYRNTDKEAARCRKYRSENPAKVKEIQRKSIALNPQKRAQIMRDYINKREKHDPEFKLLRGLRSRIRAALKRNSKSGSTVELLGCSIAELKVYIESLWLPGMCWENRSRKGWHLDHVKPLSSFDLTNPEQLAKACNYTNLQPLWWIDNLKKGDRYDDRN